MSTNIRFRRLAKPLPEQTPAPAINARDGLLLQLARILIFGMLSVIGFLINDYLNSMHKAMDGMAASIARISDNQERISVMLARVDEAARHIERRLDKAEARADALHTKKP